MYCGPSRENLILSCYTDDELKKIASANNVVLKDEDERKMVIKKIDRKLNHKCDDQICWGENTPDIEVKKIFRPVHKWKEKKWLYNDDINDALEQYEEKYPDFFNYGDERLDFWYFDENFLKQKTLTELIESGKKFISLVIFMNGYDKKNNIAQHWVVILIDLKSYEINLFDSSCYDLNRAIEFILFEFQLFLTLYFKKKIYVKTCSRPIQRYEGDCGIFVLDFVVKRLEGYSFEGYINFIEEMGPEQKTYISKIRKYYFI
jgi:hypothetical protein